MFQCRTYNVASEKDVVSQQNEQRRRKNPVLVEFWGFCAAHLHLHSVLTRLAHAHAASDLTGGALRGHDKCRLCVCVAGSCGDPGGQNLADASAHVLCQAAGAHEFAGSLQGDALRLLALVLQVTNQYCEY